MCVSGLPPHDDYDDDESGQSQNGQLSAQISSLALENNGGVDEAANHLPFILKVMSIRKTLSLQTHPNKLQAKWLHRLDPVNYPDDNHKPEMLVALTKFELLCGFRPLSQLVRIFRELIELQYLVGRRNATALFSCPKENGTESRRSALEVCVRALLACSEQVFLPKFESMARRANDAPESYSPCTLEALKIFRRLRTNYPNDVCAAAGLLLNMITLRPGEAVFYEANVPHAYLSGDCIECVSRSNNTIRAGLTSKHTDAAHFCTCLSYECHSREHYVMQPDGMAPGITLFRGSERDFQVLEVSKTHEDPSSPMHIPNILQVPSVFIVIEGCAKLEYITAAGSQSKLTQGNNSGESKVVNAKQLARGDIYFVHSASDLIVNVCELPFLAYFASENAVGYSDRLRI